MCDTENEELICILRLDCLLLDKKTIKFKAYPIDDYQNETVVMSTLEMFYAWSEYVYENSDLIRGGRIDPDNLAFEVKMKDPTIQN